MRSIPFLIVFHLLLWMPQHARASENAPVRICMEDGIWAPYLFVFADTPAGIHADMVRQALTDIGVPFQIQPMPWKRCLEWSRLGKADALLSMGYTAEHAKHYFYPEDASESGTSAQRLTQVGYAVVVRKDTQFVWTGETRAIPQPAGIPLGHGTADKLKALGIKVVYGSRYDDVFEMLIRHRVNSIVLSSELADLYLLPNQLGAQLLKYEPALTSKSLFLAVSRNGVVSNTDAQQIWEAIANVRNNAKLMRAFRQKANQEALACFNMPGHCH